MKKFKISVIIVMLGTIVSKVLGLFREILLAQKYGTGYISDSFILSLTIPTVLISAIASAISINYIPILSKIDKKNDDEARFNGNLLTFSIILSSIIVILFICFTEPIVKIFASGFNEIGLNYLTNMSRITIFCVYFIIVSYVLKGYLEYKNNFFGTSIYGVCSNIGIIIGLVLSTKKNYQILSYGILFGYILGFLGLLLVSKFSKNKFKLKINFDIKDKNLRKMIVLTIPILLNDVVWQINGIVDKSISSTLGAGYISSINYAHNIVDIVISLFGTSIVTVFFPNVIRSFNENGIEKVKENTNSILKIISFLSIPCTLLISIYSKTIVKILFFRGEFDINSLKITSIAVSIYAFIIIFTCFKAILFKVFYALQDSKSPTISAIVSIILNILLSLFLLKIFGYIGIIVATIIAAIVSTILLIAIFNKKYGRLLNKDFFISFLKIIISSLIMLIVIILIKKKLNLIIISNTIIIEIIKTFIGCLAGVVSYFISLKLLKYNFEMINKKG